jgi:hypothetical protein
MRRLVATLTALLLLANAMFGCCRHHVLKCAQASEVAAATAGHDTCCHHEQKPAGKQSSPHKCQHECCGACAYLPVERSSTVDDASSDIMLLPALIGPSPGLGLLVSLPGRTLEKPARAPTLRVHLLYQSLLI